MKTRFEKAKEKITKANRELAELLTEKSVKENELIRYSAKHKAVRYENLETADVKKLEKIYSYFDKRYKIDWQGGLRADNRGMQVVYWLDDDPDYIIFHIASTCKNICFSGSTSWIAKAQTFDDKIKLLEQTKKDIEKIIRKG